MQTKKSLEKEGFVKQLRIKLEESLSCMLNESPSRRQNCMLLGSNAEKSILEEGYSIKYSYDILTGLYEVADVFCDPEKIFIMNSPFGSYYSKDLKSVVLPYDGNSTILAYKVKSPFDMPFNKEVISRPGVAPMTVSCRKKREREEWYFYTNLQLSNELEHLSIHFMIPKIDAKTGEIKFYFSRKGGITLMVDRKGQHAATLSLANQKILKDFGYTGGEFLINKLVPTEDGAFMIAEGVRFNKYS